MEIDPSTAHDGCGYQREVCARHLPLSTHLNYMALIFDSTKKKVRLNSTQKQTGKIRKSSTKLTLIH